VEFLLTSAKDFCSRACAQGENMNNRVSGILLHISSLPSQFGIGDLGPEAYRFADFLSKQNRAYGKYCPLT